MYRCGFQDGQESDQSVVETSCKKCCFKLIGNDGKFQAGCKFRVLERMRRQGAEIKEHVSEDDQFKYFSIVDRVCVYCRPQKGWANRFQEDVDLMQMARQEVKPRMAFIIVSDGNPASLQKTLASITHMSDKPQVVSVQFKNNKVRPSEALEILKFFLEIHNVKYRIDYILESDASDMRVVDIAYKKLDRPYFAVFKEGFDIPTDFIKEIDSALNDDLERFLLLEPVDGINGLVAQTRITKQIGGSNEDLVQNKLKRVAEKQKCQYLVRPVTSLIPSMKSR